MGNNVDTTAWATFATAVGMLTRLHGLAQYVTSMATLASAVVLSHFLKRYLNQRFPPKRLPVDGGNLP